MYDNEKRADMIQEKNNTLVNKEGLLETILRTDGRTNKREKAIFLVNLIIANRSNEMV